MANRDIHPKYKSVHVRENQKSTDIRDAFNNLKYKVTLTSYDFTDDAYGMIYEINVSNHFSAPDPLIILTIPDRETELPLTDFNKALKIYNECIKRYTTLVRAETRDFQDIDIFTDKIDYKMTCPECCGTCRWAKAGCSDKDYVYGIVKTLKCHNPKNTKEYGYDLDEKPMHNHMPYPHPHIPSPTPIQAAPQPIEYEYGRSIDDCHRPMNRFIPGPKAEFEHGPVIILHPSVDFLGVCKHYEQAQEPERIRPGEKISRVIDRRIRKALDKELSSTIIPTVEEHIDEHIDETIDNHLENIDVIFGDRQ